MNLDLALEIVKDHICIGKSMDVEMYQVPEALEMVVEELEVTQKALEMCLERWQYAHRPGLDPRHKESQIATMKEYLLAQAKEGDK